MSEGNADTEMKLTIIDRPGDSFPFLLKIYSSLLNSSLKINNCFWPKVRMFTFVHIHSHLSVHTLEKVKNLTLDWDLLSPPGGLQRIMVK